MPVTAKLSKALYDQLGEDVADELVIWFNAVDETYRSDLRAVNESNFAVFDAKLGHRFAEQDARLEKRFAEQDTRIEKRFAEQDTRIEKRFAEQDARIEKRFADIDLRFERLETTLERSLKDQTRWMLFAWTTVILTVIASR